MKKKRITTIHLLGPGHRPLFKANSKMPHPSMEQRKEFNIHIFGYRVAITW